VEREREERRTRGVLSGDEGMPSSNSQRTGTEHKLLSSISHPCYTSVNGIETYHADSGTFVS
jgi:hypothetical protein